MSIRRSVIVIVLVSIAIMIIAGFIISGEFFERSVALQEKMIIANKMDSVVQLIRERTSVLESVIKDWAPWDDTWYFVRDHNPDYIESNLNYTTIKSLNVNGLVFINKDKKIIYSTGSDLRSGKLTPVSPALLDYVRANMDMLYTHNNVNSYRSVMTSLDGKLAIVTAAPITNSTFTEPQEGLLVGVRYIDTGILDNFGEILDGTITLMDIGEVDKGTARDKYAKQAFLEISRTGTDAVNPLTTEKIAGYRIIKDISDNPISLVRIIINRDIYTAEAKTYRFFFMEVIIMIVLVFGLCILLLQTHVVSPITSLCEDINGIDLNNIKLAKLPFMGVTEIRRLAADINRMLSKIERGNQQLAQSEKRLKLVLEGADVGFWDYDVNKRVMYVDERSKQIFGLNTTENYLDISCLMEVVHPDDFENVQNELEKSLTGKQKLILLEFRICNSQGNIDWIEIRGNVVESDKTGKSTRMTGITIDINDKKAAEEELRYLSCYDKVTGCYNRGYFEYLIDKRYENKDLPFAFLIGDINGLKIANDTFGHSAGDDLIVAIARTIKESCKETDIVARWGGDEFAVILPGAGEEVAEQVCRRIKENCYSRYVGPISLSISMGYSIVNSTRKNLKEVIKDAEEKMYRNKLFENKSARNSIIVSLQKTLSERSHETEEHTSRIHRMCVKVGKKLGMSDAKIDELALLAVLHDIGKIAIPDNVLNKPDKLTDEEWETMKTHSEVGYRIASESPDLSHIAYAILTHHERYDGLGYPKGLAGNEIPLMSRIVAVLDSFDVMTHDRPYRKAIKPEEAIQELRRCSGTQFDPNLVEVCISVFEENFSDDIQV